jgi:hypothetical protein
VTAGDRKANLDGRVGIAIGRDELLRSSSSVTTEVVDSAP